MANLIGTIIEGLIQYAFLGVILALLFMLIILILLHARDHVTPFLMIKPLRDKFDQLCELSDSLDQNQISSSPFGSAVWLTRLILMGVVAAAGLMILWIMVRLIRG